MKNLKVVAISGSLRTASVTQQLVNSLQDIAPEGIEISSFSLIDVPVYNQDIEDKDGFPAAVKSLRDVISEADGIIFATPEYNGAMSGVLKNAIDWASRGDLLSGRIVAPISGSPGALGGTKAQENLRSVLGHLGMQVMSRPAVAIPQYYDKIEDSKITDEQTEKFVSDWLEAFKSWIIQLNK